MAKLGNRARMTVSSTGTGPVTLNLAVAGFQTFLDANLSDGDQCRYVIEDSQNQWEIGIGTLSNSSTVMARSVDESSNSGNPLNLTSAAEVFCGVTAQDLDNAAPIFTTTPPAELTLLRDGSTAVTLNAKAYDESGIPVQYNWDAWATGGTTIYDASSLPPQLASAPSINQSTGVYSLVGSSNSNNAGTINFRVKASDGVKVATNVSQLILTFYTNPDIANLAIDTGISFTTATQDSKPNEVLMNPAGNKMYILGETNQKVYEYNLSTADDVSSAVYNNVNFSVTEDAYPRGMCFADEGNRLYIVGASSDTIFQYGMTSPYDISTASYANKSFSVSSQETSPSSLRFNNDGTRVFVLGYSSDSVNQYDLSTAYDISTAVYNSVNFSVASQDNRPTGLHFNNDGTKMYVCGTTTDDLYEYSLSTAFSVSSASYNNVKSPGSNVGGNPVSIMINSDGTKLYTVASSDDTVYRYSCN